MEDYFKYVSKLFDSCSKIEILTIQICLTENTADLLGNLILLRVGQANYDLQLISLLTIGLELWAATKIAHFAAVLTRYYNRTLVPEHSIWYYIK